MLEASGMDIMEFNDFILVGDQHASTQTHHTTPLGIALKMAGYRISVLPAFLHLLIDLAHLAFDTFSLSSFFTALLSLLFAIVCGGGGEYAFQL